MTFVLQILLAGVFGFAALAKARSPIDTRRTLRAFRIPQPKLLAILLPLAEAATAILVFLVTPLGGLAALAMLVAFTTLIVQDIREGRGTPCGCFGPGSRPVGTVDIARNVALGIAAVVLAL